jgi:deoxycytidine triphosphate deaminase
LRLWHFKLAADLETVPPRIQIDKSLTQVHGSALTDEECLLAEEAESVHLNENLVDEIQASSSHHREVLRINFVDCVCHQCEK